MVVDFDRERCAAWVIDVKGTLPEAHFVELWQCCVYPSTRPPESGTVERYMREYLQMSWWNKQGVLFAMIPYLEELISKETMRVASVARQMEPL